MEEKIKYKNIDGLTPEMKELHWGAGEWVREPDSFSFEHEGFKCHGNRQCGWDGFNNDRLYGGFFTGYLQLPPNHPWYAKDMGEIDIDCHYGLTFSQKSPDNENWIIGFDCAHSGDLVPSLEKFKKEMGDPFPLPKHIQEMTKNSILFQKTYKNINFCIQECKLMAEQAKKAFS